MKKFLICTSIAVGAIALTPSMSFSQVTEKAEVPALSELKADDSQSKEFTANYAKGVRYYNLAVEQLMSAKPEHNLDQTKQIQSKTMELFKNALPYFQKCEKLNPGNDQVKLGIDGCKFALGITSKTK